MIESYEFLKLVLDSITEHIVVIDRAGSIRFMNKAWTAFGRENNCLIKDGWPGVNYLDVCEESAAMGDAFGKEAANGIRNVIEGKQHLFYLEYPCHSPDDKRWFMMRVTPLGFEGDGYYVISHQNITERKLAEEQALNLSRIDGLTKIPNRRYFDEFLDDEWRRCARLHLPVSLAIMDVDHFKLLNDHYGHLSGDDCLVKLGAVINDFGKRPGDLFARYGGEEFALVFGNTTIEQALVVIRKLVDAIDKLGIPNEKSPVSQYLTVSVGLAMMYPDTQGSCKDLIKTADKLLYAAKDGGRNRVVEQQCDPSCGMTLVNAPVVAVNDK